MKKLAILGILFIFGALFAVSASAQGNSTTPPATKSEEPKKDKSSPLVAKWDVTISAPGQDLPGTLKLEKDGDEYKGSLLTDLGEAPFKNIKIKDDDSFTADITVNVQGQTMEGTVTGKLAEEKLSGEINLPGIGAISYAGQKLKNK